jgi:hypothetical protein
MSEKKLKVISKEEVEGKDVQYACIYILDIKRLGIEFEDISCFAVELEEK